MNETARLWMNARLTAVTSRPTTRSFSTRKKMRMISFDRSKSQWNTFVFIVPALLIRISMAVRRLVCTNCTALIFAETPLGALATARQRVTEASVCAAPPGSRSGSNALFASIASSVRRSLSESGSAGIRLSTYSRSPRSEGIRPAEVCGCSRSPSSASSAISLRTVAGEAPAASAIDFEPTGPPVRMYPFTIEASIFCFLFVSSIPVPLSVLALYLLEC